MSNTRKMSHLVVAAAMTAVIAGCMPQGRGRVPEWAIHIQRPRIDENIDVKQMAPRLIAELKAQWLSPGYVPSEQIAALAIKEIRKGRGFDAAVLLSLASYRYYQQVYYVAAVSKYNVPGNVNVSTYRHLIEAEIEVLTDIDFDDELNYLNARLDQDDRRMQILEKGRFDILRAEASEQAELAKQLIDKFEATYRAPEEDIHYPLLTQAYLERLVADTHSEYHSRHAGYYLAMTPLKAFQEAALAHAPQYFHTPICRRLVTRMSEYREVVLRELASPDPKARSNAAIILALRPSAENLGILETAYQKETDPFVRLSFDFALLQHEKGTPKTLFDAIDRCETDSLCEHAVHLIQWLPIDQEKAVPLQKVRSIVQDEGASPLARHMSVAIMADLAAAAPLSELDLAAMLRATADQRRHIASLATQAVAQMEQLDRPAVLRLLNGPVGRGALLLRLSNMPDPADLPFLESQLRTIHTQRESEQIALMVAIGSIKGQRAAALLFTGFEQLKSIRYVIAMILIERGDIRFDQLQQLAALDHGAASAALKMGARSKDADITAKEVLSKGDLENRVRMIHVVGRFGRKDLLQDIWRLTTYADSAFYPGDAYVRQAAFSVWLWYEISKARAVKADPDQLRLKKTLFRNGN
jgi:hypothetical protein